MSTNQIVPFVASATGAYSIQLTPEAIVKRDSAVESACLILSVDTAEEQITAAETIAELKGFAKGIEAAREFYKKPHRERGALVDSTAKEAVKEVVPEIERLEKLVAAYMAREKKKADDAREAARKDQERLQKIENDRIAALEKEASDRLAEAKRIADEAETARLAALKKAQEATTAEEVRAANEEANRIAAAQLETELEAEFIPAPVIEKKLIAQEYVAAPKVSGGAFKESWDYEVTDIRAFYLANPHFCELTIKRGFFVNFLNSGAVNPEQIPGIKAFKKSSFAGRSK